MSIVVNTPGGNIGRPLVKRLLAAGQEVTVIHREPTRIDDLVQLGARVVAGTFEDEGVLDQALWAAKALFWLTPPAVRPDFAEWAIAAARIGADVLDSCGLERAVVISSVGAHNRERLGPVTPLAEIEEIFQAACPNVTVLRPAFFMDNHLENVPTIKANGTIESMLPADKVMPMVATSDVGGLAADVFLDADWSGHRTLGVHGPEDLTPASATEAIAEGIGRSLEYVEIDEAAYRAAMLAAGAPDFHADAITELMRAVAEGRMDPAEERTPESTTPTTLVDFARERILPAL